MSHSSNVPRAKTLLIILDGFGVNPSKRNNAVHEAPTPCLDDYFARYPHTVIEASGRAVGLPDGQMGNSEVGHLSLGCGAVVRQDLVRIDDAIADGSFYENAALVGAVTAAREADRPLHLIGLVSDGGVHSHLDHLLALVDLCTRHGVRPVVHAITDGRDTPPSSALRYLRPLEEALASAGGVVATVCGRYYAMDRDTRWERTAKAFDALVHGEGEAADSVQAGVEAAYARGQTDEFLEPLVIDAEARVRPNDPVVFFNFRNDRPRQLTSALAEEAFTEFERGGFTPARLTTLTEYDPAYPVAVAFAPERPETCLAEVVSQAGIGQFHCAETEKYAHVTFFLNGGQEAAVPGEARKMIPSPKVATYDLQPEMSAAGVADAVIEAMRSDDYGLVVVNFANGDMVGHTAVPEAVLEAVRVLDREVGRVLDAAVEAGFSVLLTADHGNCDEYVDPQSGEPHTQHTLYPVPCLIIDREYWRLLTGGGLTNVAPTVLELMGLEAPAAMKARSLLLGVSPT